MNREKKGAIQAAVNELAKDAAGVVARAHRPLLEAVVRLHNALIANNAGAARVRECLAELVVAVGDMPWQEDMKKRVLASVIEEQRQAELRERDIDAACDRVAMIVDLLNARGRVR